MKRLRIPLMVGVLLLSVLLVRGPAAATSTADKSGAITIDGAINDGTEWATDEKFTAFVGGFTAFYITWDNTDLYFAFSGGGSTDRYVVAIDTDPGAMNGDGSEWGGATFPLYGRPDYIFEYKSGSKYQRGGIDVANVAAARDSGLEIKIPRAELGNLATGSPVGIVMYAGYDDAGYTSCSGRRIFAFFPGPGNYGNNITSGAGTGCATPVTQWYFPTTDSGRSPTTYGRYQSHIFAGRTVSPASGDQLNDIILDGGTLAGPSSGTINVGRDFVYTAANGGTFTLNSCTVAFNGTGSIKGGHTTGVTFHHVAIASGASLGADSSFLVKGNWTNAGTFAASAGAVTFNGASGTTQTISGSHNTFQNLTLNNSGATTSFGSSSVTIAGDFTASAGGMNGGASTITFTAASGIIGGASAKSFYNLVIASGATITATGGNITIAGDFANDGVFVQDASLTTTFNKAGAASLTGGGSTTFGSVLVPENTTLNAGTHSFTVTGASWQVSFGAVFDPGSATVTFDGANTKIQGNNVQQFNNVVINPGKTLTHSVAGWKVRGNWTNYGIFTAGGWGTVDFNGTGAQAIGGSASTAFHHLSISNIGADGVTMAADVTLSGELSVAANAKLMIGAGRMLIIASNTYLYTGATLAGGSGSVLYVNGGTFNNAGTVTVPDFRFDAAGLQYLAGAGTWDVAQMTMGWSQSGNSVVLSSDVTLTVHALEIRRKFQVDYMGYSGSLTVSHPAGATITVAGTGNVGNIGSLRLQGTVIFNQGGNCDATLYVYPGTTTATGTFDGQIGINSGATLQAPAGGVLTFTYYVSVSSGGTLRGNSGSVLNFSASTGTSFHQNGTVAAAEIHFDGPGSWSVDGSGSWDVGTMILGYSLPGSTVYFYTFTLNVGILEVRCHLNLPGITLTIDRPSGASIIVTSTGTVTAYPGGILRTQGTVTIVQGGSFNNKVEVYSGTTTAAGTFSAPSSGNAITVLSGATLQVAGGDTLAVNGALVVNTGGTLRVDTDGTLGGAGSLTYTSSNTLTNDGTISIASPSFSSSSAQSLAGAGRFVNNTLGVSSPLTLNSNHQVHGLTINSGRSLAASGCVLSVSGNWSNAGTFTGSGGTVVFNGAAGQSIGGGTSTTFDRLTIDNTSADSTGVTLGNHQTVNGILTLADGLLKVASYNLTLGAGSSISGGSAASMVVTDVDGSATSDGSLCKLYTTGASDPPPFTFAVGDAYNTTQYTPATVDFASTTFNSGAKACARVTNAPHPSKPAEADYPTWINRYWTVTSTAIATPFSCAVTFAYREDAADDDVHLGGGQAEVALYHKVYQGSAWSTKNQADTTNNLLSSAVTGFSDHTAFSGSPLAVDLAFFTASATAAGVTLAWETVSETDNAGFNLYRAGDETGPWVKLNAALIPAAAPGSSAGHAYTWVDATATPGASYVYRLEAVDLAGGTADLGAATTPARVRHTWLPLMR